VVGGDTGRGVGRGSDGDLGIVGGLLASWVLTKVQLKPASGPWLVSHFSEWTRAERNSCKARRFSRLITSSGEHIA
jgi:hypothetical protein